MLRRGLAIAVLGPLLVMGGCSDTRLDFPELEDDTIEFDDEIEITGDFCASPSTNIAFPVKIMFIVDGSGSQQFSDQNRQRVLAVERAVNALLGSSNTFFKVIVFNASITGTPVLGSTPVYTNDITLLQSALAGVAEADSLTDYQGALGAAYTEMLRDMADVFDQPGGQAELARTKYVTIMISDGLPDPQCRAGLGNDFNPAFLDSGGLNLLCEDQAFLNCLLQDPMNTTCDGTTCTYTDPAGNDTVCFDQGMGANNLFNGFANTELTAGADYNQPYQILDKVQDIMDLQERFEVGEMRFHSGLVLDPGAIAVLDMFGDPAQAAPLLEQMAEIGNGEFLEFNAGDGIDFLQFNFDSIKQSRVVRTFFADNLIATMGTGGLELDSDADGLSDAREFEIGTLALVEDSDDDGFSDKFEYDRLGLAYDPLDPCLPPVVLRTSIPTAPDATCGPPVGAGVLRDTVNCDYLPVFDPALGRQVKDFGDRDTDGLNDCEEIMAGTDILSFDSDSDGIPDDLELKYGLDPLRWDFDRDDDQDTIPNGQELEWHLHPTVVQSDVIARERYRYSRPQTDVTIDGRACFEYEAKRIKLLTPQPAERFAGLGPGRNEIWVYIAENLADDLSGEPMYRVACIRPQYVPPSFKNPTCGRIRLQESDFSYIFNGDPFFNTNPPLFTPGNCIDDFPDPFACDPNTGECSCVATPDLSCLDPNVVGTDDRDSCCELCF